MTIEMIDNPLFLVIKDTLYCKVPGWGVLGGLHLKIVSLPLIFTFFYQRIVFLLSYILLTSLLMKQPTINKCYPVDMFSSCCFFFFFFFLPYDIV